MTLREMIEVLEAAERGETIQHRTIAFEDSEWRDSREPTWDFVGYDFRVKPREPQTIYKVRVYGTLCASHYTERDAAARVANGIDSRHEVAQVVEFREVLP